MLGCLCPPPGHVDIAVTGPDGQVLAAQDVPYQLVPLPRRMWGWYATFRATFAMVPPSAAVITLQHHLGVHDSDAACERAEGTCGSPWPLWRGRASVPQTGPRPPDKSPRLLGDNQPYAVGEHER